jgi:8-oxo-dGTP diphosphatase
MNNKVLQFGEMLPKYIERPGAYAVIFKDEKILVLEVRGAYHLPGGGIDEGEDEKQALIREIREETGCEITNLKFIGKANQFLPKTRLGPLNKIGTFYRAELISQNKEIIMEPDHKMVWLALEELIDKPMAEFQKWAVEKALGGE